MSRFGNCPRVSTAVSTWVPSTFSPSRLSPALWFDASDANSITSSGGKVSQWNDISGNGRNATQATSANQPTTGTDTIGGLNALTFGASTWIVTSAYSPPTSGFTTFAVANQTTASDGYIWEQSSDNTARRYFWRSNTQIGKNLLVFGYNDSPNFRDYTVSYPASAGARLLMGRTVGNDVGVAVYSTPKTSETWLERTNYPQSGSRAVTLGNSAATTKPWNGTIGEILVYDSELSFANCRLVLDYLRAKWSL